MQKTSIFWPPSMLAENLNQAPVQSLTAFDCQQSDRLIMQKPAGHHIEKLFEIFSDPRTNTFNPAGPYRERAEAEAAAERRLAHWEWHGFGEWAVSLKSAPAEIIGFGGISYALFGEKERINLGYQFSPDVWGKGIASEFAEAAVLSAFRILLLPSVFARVRENHLVSRRVLEKTGLRQIGVLPDAPGVPAWLIFQIKRPALEIYA